MILVNNGHSTCIAWNRDTAVPAEGNGDLQALIHSCGETQTMSHVVKSCPLTKLNGSLSRLHSADEDAVLWLTSYGSWNAYEKKKIVCAAGVGSTNVICPYNRTHNLCIFVIFVKTGFYNNNKRSNTLTKSASRGAHSPVRGHPRGSKFVPLNSWSRVSY